MTRRLKPVALPAELAASYRRDGLLNERSLPRVLPSVASRWPWRDAVTEGDRTLTFGELLNGVQRIAGFLASAGIGSSDVVCWQTPNWWEAHMMSLAVWHVGAISNPVVAIYRDAEVRHIVRQLEPDAVVTCGTFRGFDHAEMFDDILRDEGHEPKLKMIIRTERTGWTSFSDALTAAPQINPTDLAPEDPALVLYTSGTTAAAKGVMLSSRSLLSETSQVLREWGLGWGDTGYMPAPLPHITGVTMGLVTPLSAGARIVLSERWDAELAVREIAQHRATYSAGATVFLQELSEQTARVGATTTLQHYACGGAPVPVKVMQAAEDVGIHAFRCYGMTECSSVTMLNGTYPFELRSGTDGRLAQGVEAVTVDSDGNAQSAGAEGELHVRGPEQMIGYVDADETSKALDIEGWFHTGDVGVVNEAGYVRITGRLKDIINRGGEKFAAREIEDRILGHAAVHAVAVVPAPHERFGEVPAAFVVVDHPVSTDELSEVLSAGGLARQKIPVHWRFVDALPMTSTGKVRKNQLAEQLADSLSIAP